jgi:hypothetical protein
VTAVDWARYLIWSNEHAMWWRDNQRGYTQYIEEAGRYERAEAVAIVRRASLDGRLGVRREDPVTGFRNLILPEVMVSAPEEITGLLQWAVKD